MNPAELLDVSDAARYLGLSVSFLNKARMHGGNGPVFFKLGSIVRYSREDIDAWVASRRQTHPEIVA